MKAYNKLYYKGKIIGKAHITAVKTKKETTDEFKKRVKKDNKNWNKKNVNSNYSTKLVKIGSSYYKRKRR